MFGKIRSLGKSLGKVAGLIKSKTWDSAQKYELDHAIKFMRADFFKKLHQDTVSGKLKISEGYINEMMLQEFFGGEHPLWREFENFIKGKRCLDVGPCVYSPLACWDTVAEKYAIEPLFEGVDRWQKQNLGASAFEGIKVFSDPAERTIPEIVGKIDGAIYCRNMLDHSPYWPFTLVNLSKYASAGCKLLLWTDLDHGPLEDEGHFDITKDLGLFKELVEMLGFRVIREYSSTEVGRNLNWGCYAEKK